MPDLDGQLIQLSDEEVDRLVIFYTEAENEILNELNRALLRGNKIEYFKDILTNVQTILRDLRNGSRTWCQEAIPQVYAEGVKVTDVQIKSLGKRMIAGNFNTIHQQAAQVLAEAAYNRLLDVTQTIGRRVEDIYRAMAMENVRGSVAGYKTWQQAAERYREQLAKEGITGFKDKRGRQWNMRSYSEMVARTTTMEAHLEGTKNRLLEYGHDLVKVSRHSNPCDYCKPWEGRILSLTGKTPGYPTIDDAKDAKLFHPNCRHAYGIFLAELA